jgi:cell division protein FtsB
MMAEPAPAWATLFKRRNADGRRELAELREENARLRREVERLKGGKGTAGSTDIQEL